MDKKTLITFVIIIVGVLTLQWLMFDKNGKSMEKYTKELIESEKREAVLKSKIQEKDFQFILQQRTLDSMNTVLNVKQQNLENIGRKYKDLKDQVKNLSDDESIEYLKQRLQ